MAQAIEIDQENIVQGKPALARHRLLSEVISTLSKYLDLNDQLFRVPLQDVLLDSGVLSVVREWLEPLPDYSMPVDHIRKALLELLRSLPIETDHLRESRLGHIVMFMAQRPGENPEIQRLAKELVSRWSRPIIGVRSSEQDGEEFREAPTVMQSAAYREVYGRASLGGAAVEAVASPGSTHYKLAMRMQKKARGARRA